jgi:F-type H+-transporting ATPase subunit delta
VTTSAAARTYARALLEAAGADASRVADELDAFAAVRTDAPAEWAQLVAPGIPAAARKGTIDRFLADSHALVRNLLKVLVDNGRLDQAPDVAAEFRALVRELERQLDVHVTSAIELSSDLRTKLEQRLSESTGKQVRLHASVDPSIIGGLVVRHGDTLVDTSLRGRLDQLRLALSRPTPRPATTDSSAS